MLKNDHMMMIFTGLVLAVFAGSMVKYGDRIIALMSGSDVVASQDDSYSVRAGASQILDVLSNDTVKGQIVVLSNPSCGTVELTGADKLTYSSDATCQGKIAFTYCVDSKGTCAPNSVKINVISVAYAGNTPKNTAAQKPSSAGATPQTHVAPPVQVAQQAPQVETFSVQMAPPVLASPSVSEIVSPGVAVASIRQPTGGLRQTASADQNIAAQNSATVAQTETMAPTGFGSQNMGESNTITLGGGHRVITSAPASPAIRANTNPGSPDTAPKQLERGPVAMAALNATSMQPSTSESAPLSARPERSVFTPGQPSGVQTAAAQPETKFSAGQADTGPIALVALVPTASNTAAGESLNVLLNEPGRQSFTTPPATPLTLAPTAPAPQAATVLAHAPNVAAQAAAAPRAPRENNLGIVAHSVAPERRVAQGESSTPRPSAAPHGLTTADNGLSAAPVQVAVASKVTRYDIMSPYISISQSAGSDARIAPLQRLAASTATQTSKPDISLKPAAIQQASLQTPPAAPQTTAPAQNSDCAISLNTQSTRGARISVDVLAPCKPYKMLTIQHASLAFSLLTDAQGAAHVMLPALEAKAEITVVFTDGSQASASTDVRDMASVKRVGVSWENGMNLNLDAIEFGAAARSEGRVSPAAPRDYRTARIKGGGYLVQLGDPTLAGGKQAEVYTFPITRGQQRGTIAMSVILDNPASVCGQSIAAKTVHTRSGQSAGVRNIRFIVPACGQLSSQMELPHAVDDLRIAGR